MVKLANVWPKTMRMFLARSGSMRSPSGPVPRNGPSKYATPKATAKIPSSATTVPTNATGVGRRSLPLLPPENRYSHASARLKPPAALLVATSTLRQ